MNLVTPIFQDFIIHFTGFILKCSFHTVNLLDLIVLVDLILHAQLTLQCMKKLFKLEISHLI